jgi:hypothetical protein
MKMGPGLFWGLIFLFLGIALIIKVIFKLDIPVFRLFIALVLIFIGIRMLVGRTWFYHGHVEANEVIFGEKTFKPVDLGFREYNTVFGNSVFDFSEIDSTLLPKSLKISTIFGGSQIILPKNVPVELKGSAVFGSLRLPDGHTAVFGSTEYHSPGSTSTNPPLMLEVAVVFGEIQVVK